MREHFERIITRLVDLSAQSRELETIKAQVNEMSNRLQELGLTNTNLRTEITQAWDAVRQVEKDRDQYRAQTEERDIYIQNLKTAHDGQVASLNDQLAQHYSAIVGRDSTIAELNAKLDAANAQVAEQTHRAEAAEREAQDWHARADGLAQTLQQSQAHNAELQRQVSDLNQRVRELDAMLTKVRSVFEAVQAQPNIALVS